jgi:hypothetical protein
MRESRENEPKRVGDGSSHRRGYQRRHGVKANVETGETLDARRRKIAEGRPTITASGKCGPRHQGGGGAQQNAPGGKGPDG